MSDSVTPIRSRRGAKPRRRISTPPVLVLESVVDDEKMLEDAECDLIEKELTQLVEKDKQDDDTKSLKHLAAQIQQEDWKLNAAESLQVINNRQIF